MASSHPTYGNKHLGGATSISFSIDKCDVFHTGLNACLLTSRHTCLTYGFAQDSAVSCMQHLMTHVLSTLHVLHLRAQILCLLQDAQTQMFLRIVHNACRTATISGGQ